MTTDTLAALSAEAKETYANMVFDIVEGEDVPTDKARDVLVRCERTLEELESDVATLTGRKEACELVANWNRAQRKRREIAIKTREIQRKLMDRDLIHKQQQADLEEKQRAERIEIRKPLPALVVKREALPTPSEHSKQRKFLRDTCSVRTRNLLLQTRSEIRSLEQQAMDRTRVANGRYAMTPEFFDDKLKEYFPRDRAKLEGEIEAYKDYGTRQEMGRDNANKLAKVEADLKVIAQAEKKLIELGKQIAKTHDKLSAAEPAQYELRNYDFDI